MRGEMGVMEGQQHQQPQAPGLHGNRSKSPPLSSAPSQASLSHSDRSPSEAELSHASSSVSLTSSPSRPPSASPHSPPPDDTGERESPSHNGRDSSPSSHISSPGPDASPLPFTVPTVVLDGGEDGSSSLQDGGPSSLQDGPSSLQDGPPSLQDGPFQHGEQEEAGERGSDVEEEYFEEYHLPNTHENAFVRHRSFRRKVELTPINAPDAEKIEGLVRTGEFERHGSMRRKIVPNVDLYKVDEVDGPELDPHTPTKQEVHVREFKKDFREIEKLMDGNVEMDNEEDDDHDSLSPDHDGSTPRPMIRGGNVYTSTPSAYASTADYNSIDFSASLHSGSVRDPSASEDRGPESMSIEQSTINKVRDCMDFSKCKDIYNLSGKLQDILTPVEVEEVLNNSHRYIDYIDSGVLEALFTSVSEQMSLTGQPLSISFNKSDVSSKPKTPEQELTPEQVQLQYQIKQKLLMEELALDSLPYVGHSSNGGPVEEDLEDQGVVMSPKKDDLEVGAESRFGTIERRKSLRLKAGRSQVEVEGVFVESDFKDSKLKKISAPSMDLALSGSQDDLEDDLSGLDTSQDTEVDVPLDSTITPVPSDGHDIASLDSCAASVETSTNDTSSHLEGSEPTDVLANGTSASAAAFPVEGPPPPRDAAGGEEEGHWRDAVIGGTWRRIDMQVIGPYTKCISSGGQHCGHPVVVVSACQLPPRSAPRYAYVMDHLFLYLLSRLEQLVSEDYILVYLSGGRNISSTGPSFHWLKTAYHLIDRKLRKNLRALLVVHPTLWVRTIVALTRPFISSKFYRKLTFVYSLTELAQLIPLDQLDIPDSVKEADFQLMAREKRRGGGRRSRPVALPQ